MSPLSTPSVASKSVIGILFLPSRICQVSGDQPLPFGSALSWTTRLWVFFLRVCFVAIFSQLKKTATSPGLISECL